MWSLGALPDGMYQQSFPAAAYAAYAAGRGYSGYPSFGLPYPTGYPGYSYFPTPNNTAPGHSTSVDRNSPYFEHATAHAAAQHQHSTVANTRSSDANVRTSLHRDQYTPRVANVNRPLDLSNGQLTPNNNTPLLTQALSGSPGAPRWQAHQPMATANTQQPQDAHQQHQRHFSVSFAVMNNYQAAAAAAAQGFGPPASPHQANNRGGFPQANSPGPIDMYSSSGADNVGGYVQAASPQPSGFPAIAVSRAPLNYSPGPLIPAAFTNGYH